MKQHPIPEPVMDEAIAWTVRISDPDFTDWGGFTTWMEADPLHVEAYHAANADLSEMTEVLEAAPPDAMAPIATPTRIHRRWVIPAMAAIAAALVAVVGIHTQLHTPAPTIYETSPGKQLEVALEDGSWVKLNGDTRIEAERDNPRSLVLIRGEALFTVKHDDTRPFTVVVGNANIVDVGTVFDVVHGPEETRVAVSEGSVDWTQRENSVRVSAGRSLRTAAGSVSVQMGTVTPAMVGGFAKGQLFFDGETLARASTDLARTVGLVIAIDPAISQQSIRATLRLSGTPEQIVQRFALLLDLRATRDNGKWRLSASP